MACDEGMEDHRPAAGTRVSHGLRHAVIGGDGIGAVALEDEGAELLVVAIQGGCVTTRDGPGDGNGDGVPIVLNEKDDWRVGPRGLTNGLLDLALGGGAVADGD